MLIISRSVVFFISDGNRHLNQKVRCNGTLYEKQIYEAQINEAQIYEAQIYKDQIYEVQITPPVITTGSNPTFWYGLLQNK